MKDIWGALADPIRREILTMLQKEDKTAGEISAAFPVSNATISHHLKILREADLVTSKKEKQTITYSLNLTVFQEFLMQLSTAFGRIEQEEQS